MSVSQTCPNCRVNFFGPTHNVNENLCDDCVESELLQHPAVAAALAAAEQRGREATRKALMGWLNGLCCYPEESRLWREIRDHLLTAPDRGADR